MIHALMVLYFQGPVEGQGVPMWGFRGLAGKHAAVGDIFLGTSAGLNRFNRLSRVTRVHTDLELAEKIWEVRRINSAPTWTINARLLLHLLDILIRDLFNQN